MRWHRFINDPPSADLLEEMTTLIEGQADDLKIQVDDMRLWLARCGVEDGEPFSRTVHVEMLLDGRWQSVASYDGDRPSNPIDVRFMVSQIETLASIQIEYDTDEKTVPVSDRVWWSWA